MSLKILPIPALPEATARVVGACFPDGTRVVQLRDALGTLYSDEDFADLFPARGQPAEAAWRRALVTVLQFVEGLPDRRAADAACGAQSAGLEVRAQPRGDRPRLRPHGALRVAHARRGRRRGAALARHRPGTGARTRLAHSARQTTHRLAPCAGGRARAHAPGRRGRDAAPYTQRAGRSGARVAASSGAAGVGRALRASRRGSSPAQRPSRARALCQRGGGRMAGGWRADGGRMAGDCSTARRPPSARDARDDPTTPAWLQGLPAWLQRLPAVQRLHRVWAGRSRTTHE